MTVYFYLLLFLAERQTDLWIYWEIRSIMDENFLTWTLCLVWCCNDIEMRIRWDRGSHTITTIFNYLTWTIRHLAMVFLCCTFIKIFVQFYKVLVFKEKNIFFLPENVISDWVLRDRGRVSSLYKPGICEGVRARVCSFLLYR